MPISLLRPSKGLFSIPGNNKKSQPTYFLNDRKCADGSLSLCLLGYSPWWRRIENDYITKRIAKKQVFKINREKKKLKQFS